MAITTQEKPQLNPGLKLVLDLGPLLLFFFANSKPQLFAPLLAPFLPERGKIQPRRISGTCALHQRKLQTAIKRARQLALVPYVTD